MIRKQISKSALILFIIFTFYSCSYEGPTDVFNPDETGSAKPEITNIEPADFALAQYTEITISGSNFASGQDSTKRNIVYFNNIKGTIVSESQTEMIVIAPEIFGDDITIKVSVPGAFEIAEFPNYRIELLSTKNEAFLEIEKVLGIAVDADEILYAGMKIGTSITIYKVEPGKEEKTEFGTAPFPVITEMRIGPNNALFIQPGNRNLYTISSAGGEASIFANLPKNVKYFDFDENHNIYTGGSKTGIFRIANDGTISEVGSLTDFDLKCIRVFDGYVYYSALYKGTDELVAEAGVWRSQIATDGNLGEAELVFDWSESGIYSTSKIGTITLASDGTIFIGSDSGDNPIVVVHPDGSNEALYQDVLFTKTLQFVWGNTNILYHNVVNNDVKIMGVYEIFIIDWESAPYYGRQ